MVSREYAYIATGFSQKDIKPFVHLTSKITTPNDLYYSEDTPYVKGDVSNLLHTTVFYGLKDELISQADITKFTRSIEPFTLKLGGLTLRKEYRGFCQILWVDVVDPSGELKKISESFKKFPYEPSEQLEFIPHMTLAYVNNSYELPVLLPEYPKEIEIESFVYFQN